MNTQISSPSANTMLLPARWLERIGVVLLLAMPFMIFFGIALTDIALSGLAGLFVIRSLILRDWQWCRQTWVICGLLLWVYVIALSPFAYRPHDAWNQASTFGRFVLFAAALQCWLLRSTEYRRRLLYALGAALLLIAINTFWGYLSGVTLIGTPAIYSSHHTHLFQFEWLWQRASYQRMIGFNHKPNNGTLITWACFPFIGAMLAKLNDDNMQGKLFAAIAILAIIAAVLLNGERTAFFELGLGFVLLFCMAKSLRKTLFMIGIAALICVVLLTMTSNGPGLWYRYVTASILQTKAIGQHNAYHNILHTAIAMFQAHPIFGVGLNQFKSLWATAEFRHFNAFNTHAQNLYLEWLSGTGLIGTGLFLGILCCWLKRFWQARKRLAIMPIAIAAVVGLLIRAWPFASTTSFFFAWGGISFWWMGAWALAILDQQETEAHEHS